MLWLQRSKPLPKYFYAVLFYFNKIKMGHLRQINSSKQKRRRNNCRSEEGREKRQIFETVQAIVAYKKSSIVGKWTTTARAEKRNRKLVTDEVLRSCVGCCEAKETKKLSVNYQSLCCFMFSAETGIYKCE